MFEEYTQYDATGLSSLIEEQSVSTREVLDAALNRMQQWNSKVNAVIYKDVDGAIETCEKNTLLRSQFNGVPFLIKDLITEAKGFPMYCGGRATGDHVAETDSEVVGRYRSSGLNIIGTTNTAEFGLMPVSESQRFGAVKNPWDLKLNAGGSSGGSAAAVAAGIVPVAGATDGGGSIRIPAAFTGTFGFKPSRGLIPQDPLGEPWDGAAVTHVISRTVRDSHKLLLETSGLTNSSPYANRFPSSLSDLPNTKAGKVLVCRHSPMGDPVCQENIDALDKAIGELESFGYFVEEIDSLWDGFELLDAFCPVLFAQLAADLQLVSNRCNRTIHRKELEPTTWLLAEMGKYVSAKEFASSKSHWYQFRLLMAKYFESYDFILTPVTANSAPMNGELSPKSQELAALNIVNLLGVQKFLSGSKYFKENFYQSFKPFPFTLMANLTGIPAVSVPIWKDGSCLPSAVQIMAPIGMDATLFSLCYQLEEAMPWFQHYSTLDT